MSIHLHMLPPSVNNLTARVFMRASGLDFEESNAWGQTRSPEFMAKVPSGAQSTAPTPAASSLASFGLILSYLVLPNMALPSMALAYMVLRSMFLTGMDSEKIFQNRKMGIYWYTFCGL